MAEFLVSMSEFVNYNKRDVGLPADCKDLIDLLRRKDSLSGDARLEDFEVARDEVLTGCLSDLEIHIQAFCNFHGAFSELRMTEPDDQITVWFNRTFYSELEGNISLPPGSPHQQDIRSFLKSRRLKWLVDSEFPKTTFPGIPIQIFQQITPIPAVPAELSRLTLDLFLYVGLEGRSSLQYRHWMIAKK